MSVNSTECVATYTVDATLNGVNNMMSESSRTLPVTLDGLDVCNSSYVFTGYVTTPGGVAGNMSSPFNFIANLSGECPHYYIIVLSQSLSIYI